mgnify:FL=1
MKITFYITGIVDFQDLLPAVITSIRRGHECRVYIFDCLQKKRQFYYYDQASLVNFVQSVLKANAVTCEVKFYGQHDQKAFNREFDSFTPDYIMLQNAKHRYPIWYPTSGDSKIIHFAWHMDSAQALVRGHYKAHLNVVKRSLDLAYYGSDSPDWLELSKSEKDQVSRIQSRYFGNFRLESLNYNSFFDSLRLEGTKNKKTCFICEAHLKPGKDNYTEIPKFVDELLERLHKNNYYVFWKKREKGYPKEKWNSPLDFCKNSPDFIIEKDLNFPSAIVYLPYVCDASFVINTSCAYWDVKKVNMNAAMLQTKDPGSREEKYIKLVYEKGDPNEQFDLIKMHENNSWETLDCWLAMGKKINYQYIRQQSPSTKLLKYMESEFND